MLSRHPARLSILASTALALALLAPGCALQGEGERCSQKNGNADCGEGLSCVAASALGGQSDICCPQNSEHPACVPTTPTSGSTSSSSASGAGGASSTSGSGGTSSTSGGTGGTSGGTGGTGGAGGAGGTGG